MKIVFLLFFLLATSIQGGFAALDNDNPLTNPDLPPKVRAQLESRILEWLCPRIKMTASSYIRSRKIVRGHLPPFFMIYNNMRSKLTLWLERLTPAQKQKLDNALMESVAAYLKTHPNAFMVVCLIDNTVVCDSDDLETICEYPIVYVYTLNADVNDTVSIYLSPSNSTQAVVSPFCIPTGSWYSNNPFSFTCRVKRNATFLGNSFYWGISSVTYSHGGKQIVLTQKKPVFWSN